MFALPLLGACEGFFKKSVLAPQEPARLSPVDQARRLFASGDYAKAESASLLLSQEKSLSKEDTAEASRILAAAAILSKHPSVALTGLERWRLAAPGVDGSREWQDAWCKALRALSSHDARTRANELYQDTSRGARVRSVAGITMAVRQWQDGDLGQSMAALENIYTSASSKEDKAELERRLALELHLAPASAGALAASAASTENKGRFPYNIILIEQLRRQSQKPETRDAALEALRTFAGQTTLAAPSLLKNPPSEGSISISGPAALPAAPSGPATGRTVALALPLSGQYAAISGKIQAGAQAACDEFASKGQGLSLLVIDTDQPDWTARVDALPQDAVVVGGPLRRTDYAGAKSRGLTTRRAVFAFLPALDSGDEGRSAWRFFYSAKDQVDALLDFTNRLGISG